MATGLITIALSLIALGVGGYLGTGRSSVTALIPAFVGVPLLVLGIAAARATPSGPRRIGLAAVILGLVGFAGSAPGLLSTAVIVAGGEVARPTAAILRAAMAVLCAGVIVVAVVGLRGRAGNGPEI